MASTALNLLTKRFDRPWMPMALYFPLGLFIALLSLQVHPRPLFETALWVLAGIFSWTLIEYFLHRFVFHWTQVKEPWRTLASGLHMEHHRTANTADLILAPPVSGLFFGTLVYLLFALFTWSFSAAALLEAGVFLGYLAYEWIHFGAHRYKMESRLGRFLKNYHLRHHFKNPSKAYGVTTPFWDWVFGTRPL